MVYQPKQHVDYLVCYFMSILTHVFCNNLSLNNKINIFIYTVEAPPYEREEEEDNNN